MTKQVTSAQREALSTIGRMGGKATAKKHGKKYMQKIGKQGWLKRVANKKTA